MAGVKGRSGRRKNSEENRRLIVLQKAWELIEKNIDNPELPIGLRLEIAAKLAVKNMPTEIVGDFKVTQMPQIKVDGQEKEFFVGYPRFTQDVSDTAEATTNN